MAKRVKKKSYENLSAKNIETVIALLNPSTETEKPITKKDACNILNIAYNTNRLDAIIEGHIEQKAYVKKRKKSLRGRPASNEEIADACERYLTGDNISDISKSLFRSPTFVRNLLETVGVPQRPSGADERLSPHYYPDECMAEDFNEGEIAWSATFHAPVEIKSRLSPEYIEGKKGMKQFDYEAKYGCPAYAVYIKQKIESEDTFFASVNSGGFNAYAPAYELCKLEHLRQYGVKIERL
jgi:hypothetical protein